jgi:hypothetical protein
MVVWNSHVAEIIIILLGVVKQHVRFIREYLSFNSYMPACLSDRE